MDRHTGNEQATCSAGPKYVNTTCVCMCNNDVCHYRSVCLRYNFAIRITCLLKRLKFLNMVP